MRAADIGFSIYMFSTSHVMDYRPLGSLMCYVYLIRRERSLYISYTIYLQSSVVYPTSQFVIADYKL